MNSSMEFNNTSNEESNDNKVSNITYIIYYNEYLLLSLDNNNECIFHQFVNK